MVRVPVVWCMGFLGLFLVCAAPLRSRGMWFLCLRGVTCAVGNDVRLLRVAHTTVSRAGAVSDRQRGLTRRERERGQIASIC